MFIKDTYERLVNLGRCGDIGINSVRKSDFMHPLTFMVRETTFEEMEENYKVIRYEVVATDEHEHKRVLLSGTVEECRTFLNELELKMIAAGILLV